MNKKQATQFVSERLRNGDHPETITDELSRMLNAPPEITQRFIDQVAANLPEMPLTNQVETQEPRPDWMEDIVTESPGHQTPPQSSRNTDLPPGLQSILLENEGHIEPGAPPPTLESPTPPGEDLPRQAKFVPHNEERISAEDGPEGSPVDLEILADEVLNQLKKKRRNNDIIEDVCNKTGWHWNKAQRFVARIKTKNFEKLQSTQNRNTMIVGGIIILIGLAMAIAGGSTIADYAKIAVFARTNPEVLLTIAPEFIFFALIQTVTGIGMIIGGSYGISRAITDH